MKRRGLAFRVSVAMTPSRIVLANAAWRVAIQPGYREDVIRPWPSRQRALLDLAELMGITTIGRVDPPVVVPVASTPSQPSR